MKQRIAIALLCLCLFPAAALAQRTPSPEGAYIYIGWPNEGETLRCENFRVWFGLRGMGIAPAQQQKPNTGHHHLLVDVDLPPFDETRFDPLPEVEIDPPDDESDEDPDDA